MDWFKGLLIFYDQSFRDFKNRGKQDKLLYDKVSELGLSGNLICLWFRRMVYGNISMIICYQ